MPAIYLLLVDDSQTFLRAAQVFLRQYPDINIIGTAHNGGEALALAVDLHPDIILLDLNMAGGDGLTAIHRLRQIMPRPGLIVLTQYDLDAYRNAAFQAGADAFVAKRRMAQEIVPAIQAVFQMLREIPASSLPADEARLSSRPNS